MIDSDLLPITRKQRMHMSATEHIDREFSFNKAKTLLQDSNALKGSHQ